MSLHAPAALARIDTPALLLDRAKLERNLDAMAALFADRGVRLRPHAKTHKSPIVARMQMDRGAIGVCCAKLGEAEALADGGITELLVTTEIIGPLKIARLIELARRASVTIVVDDAASAQAIAAASASRGMTLQTLVDIDVGQHRTGVAPGAPAVALAQYVSGLSGLELAGLQGYEGHIQHVAGTDERRAANAAAMDLLCSTAEAFRANGLSTRIVTTGGTGTSIFAAEYAPITDVQPGSYAVMDAQYGDVDGVRFEHALTVLSTVVSVRDGTAIVDAGLKSLSTDVGMPRALGVDGSFTLVGDEHGKITFSGARTLAIGDVVEIVPSHCDTTINLYDEYVVHAGGEVVDRWPVAGRGRSR